MPPFEMDYSELLFWTDAHLSPAIARWMIETFSVKAASVRSQNLREADDIIIFMEARKANAILISKDADIVKLLSYHGQPPKVIWLTCGNTSNKVLKQILNKNFDLIIEALIVNNDPLIEIND